MIEEKGTDHRLSSVCDSCPAHCCSRSYGYTQISLTYDERQNPLFIPHLSDDKRGLKLEGRHCRFLDVLTHRCTIYEQRPVACQGFVCYDTLNQGNAARAVVRKNKKLAAHLEKHGVLPELKADMYWIRNEFGEISRPTEDKPKWPPHAECYEAGTFSLMQLCATTGKIRKIGRYRSTRREYTHGKYYKMHLEKKFGTFAAGPEYVKYVNTNESSDIIEACAESA